VPVHVVQIADGTAVIDKGLSAGQRVVVDGQYKLKQRDGWSATIAEGDAAPNEDRAAPAQGGKPASGSSN
jgi:multidrug efflux system membrane fusion protein